MGAGQLRTPYGQLYCWPEELRDRTPRISTSECAGPDGQDHNSKNGSAKFRALKVPALGLDHKDLQAVGNAGRLEEPLRSDGVQLRDR